MIQYKKYFRLSEMLALKCPRCNSGNLSLAGQEINKVHTAEYEHHKERHGPTAELYEARFVVMLQCSGENCFESISVSGIVALTEEYVPGYRGEYEVEYVDIFKPKMFDPPIHLISMLPDYPSFLKESLIDSFRVFWVDPSACGNRIRVALEALLTHFKIPRINHKKKTPINLHQRIELFKQTYPKYHAFADHLFAIKWLGNAASHDELSHDDVMKAYEILEYVLEEVFGKRAEKIKRLAGVINKSKGKKTSSTGIR